MRSRLRLIWYALREADTQWAEIASGLALMFLRGAVLTWGPAITVPSDVATLLSRVGITEGLWGTYLMVCGGMQAYAAVGQKRSNLRLGATIAILAGFVIMAAAFLATYRGKVNASLVCMSVFYTLLLGRVYHDRDSATAGVGAGHG